LENAVTGILPASIQQCLHSKAQTLNCYRGTAVNVQLHKLVVRLTCTNVCKNWYGAIRAAACQYQTKLMRRPAHGVHYNSNILITMFRCKFISIYRVYQNEDPC